MSARAKDHPELPVPMTTGELSRMAWERFFQRIEEMQKRVRKK